MALLWPWSTTEAAILAIVSAVVYKVWKFCADEKELHRLERRLGCGQPRLWASHVPWGLDLLVKAFWHARNQTVCEFFAQISELSGPTHEQRLLGSRNIGTTAPANLEAILSKQAQEFNLGFRIPQFRDLMGSGVFTQEGADWHYSRNLLRPIFSANRYEGFEDIRRCVENMLDEIVPDAVVDLQPLFFRLTLEITMFMLFGDSAHTIVTESAGDLNDAFSEAQEYLAHRTRVGDFHWLINGPGMRRACRVVHSIMDAAVDKALTRASKQLDEAGTRHRYVFIDALISETQDRRVLRDQCLSMLLAGRDSTAACLSWTLRLLARHPDSLAKVRNEIAAIMGLGADAPRPSRDELKQMTYLKLVMKESLRLYPPVAVNQRAASRTTKLPEGGGPDGQLPILVRKGESVGYSLYAMHRREDIYGNDAKEFRPERWENDALKTVGYGYLPFGAGQRVCLGQEFSMLEATYTVARMVQRFPFITVADGQTVEIGKEKQILTLVVTSAEGCQVQLHEQSSSPHA